ncbi:MerR family transcriptional regulator [Viridibacillus sp. FSL R5-0477]|uniref:MerR family transcriptional regulator n=1 Tax=Viridibacillus arenosi FSL R5-213 TaxID=1227360 RepID=W4F5H7_9BACL|nr:MerR family transcriptional regulator [Viridibacillus arenosi]ETT88060.1 MerR family transcriptional regulator [Viridibacillus arenosi FSL R5-213]
MGLTPRQLITVLGAEALKISEFIKKVNTTKDTIRHYEELDLVKPKWTNGIRDYSIKDISDFHAIKEMQLIGFTLKDVQEIFNIKRTDGCGSEKLIQGLLKSLDQELEFVLKEEQELQYKKNKIRTMMLELNQLM